MTCDYGQLEPDGCDRPATHWVHWGSPLTPNRLCEEHTEPIYEDQKDPLIGPYIQIRPLKETE
ncbi:hypothetical protein JOF45_000385 [Nesterenkonia lacusekhoensis]|uniref:Uncharacterized protein n=1 Tax=Nesterenkonia lacusekhoensis TaxID=150832 RepID=A0ABS4T272_9MICC|nr:hypothetical protein [Nesterenkonia lacusekhoensis]